MVAFLAWKSRYRFELAVAGGVCAIAIFSSPIGLRFMQSDVATGDQRFDLWRIGLASLQQYWVAGAGIGNFKDAFAQYFLLTPHRPLAWDRPAHSVLLQSAVELGSIGLLLVLAFWYRQFVELRSVRSTQIVENVCLALRASVLGLFISGLSLDLFTAKYTWMTFSLVAMMRTVFLKRSSQ
jgi:O-antigen ligase